GGESPAAGALLQPAPKEGLAASVLPTHRLELRLTRSNGLQLFADGGCHRIEAHRQLVKARRRHRAAAQRTDDLVPPRGTDHCELPPASLSCCSRSLRFKATVREVSSQVSTSDWSMFSTRRAALSAPCRRISDSLTRCARALHP